VYPQSLDNVPVWDDRTWRTHAPQNSDLSADVCVIGLGGSGLTAITELLDLGRLESLVPELAGTVRTARLQMLATAPTREIDIPCPVYARYGFDYYQQLPDGSVALGGERIVHAQRASRAGRIAARHVGNRRLLWNRQRGGRTLRAGRGPVASGDSSEFARLLVNAGTPETH
jgi:hypothetical protein